MSQPFLLRRSCFTFLPTLQPLVPTVCSEKLFPVVGQEWEKMGEDRTHCPCCSQAPLVHSGC